MADCPLPSVRLPPARDYVAYNPNTPTLGMNLHALDLTEWIEVDERLPHDLTEKQRLLHTYRDAVLAISPAGNSGSLETLALLADHLPARYPQVYERRNGYLRNRATGEKWNLSSPALHPLEVAARLVQEDLCVMGQIEPGGEYRLTAACVCFPTRWNLSEKAGRAVNVIHEPVPGYTDSLASPMNRFFDRLRADRPIWRTNWSLLDDPSLFQPNGHRPAAPSNDINAHNAGERLWLRTERQTLRRLPVSGDILFTIRIYVNTLASIAEQPGRAVRLAEALQRMNSPMADYKGLAAIHGAAVAWLLNTG
jgi:hypothetical protein